MTAKTKNEQGNPRIVIFGDPNRLHATEAQKEFREFAKGKVDIIANCFGDSCTPDMLEDADFAVVFGGDGTILSAARTLAKAYVPVVGVNVGRLGFLAEFSIGELKEMFDRIFTEKELVEKRMLLRCNIYKDGKRAFTSTAVNDAVITAGEPFNMIETKLSVNSEPLAGCMSDGIIVSTPTGSTAYNLSAGGPILSATISAMVVTPVSPHSLSFRPIVIDSSNTVTITPVRVNKNTTVSLDGQVFKKLDTNMVVEIKRDDGAFLVVNNPLRTQWDTLATKLSWAEKPRYVNDIKD